MRNRSIFVAQIIEMSIMIESKRNEVARFVGSRIRGIRKSKGLTIEQLAFEIGIEYTQLSRIERGRINTSIFQLFLISKALNICFSEIMNGIEYLQHDFCPITPPSAVIRQI